MEVEMPDVLELWEHPSAQEFYMFAGWRQWADAGMVSSGLPEYLVKQTKAHQIGIIRPDGFYMFQIPGTHDLVRPVVKFKEGYPESLQTQRNEIFYAEVQQRGLIYFIGDEPHLDIERYSAAVLEIASHFNVKRIIGFGGVYGEMPYDKERMISSTYSLETLKDEVRKLSVNLSDYHGGASIGSFLCRRAGDLDLEYISFYAFVPTYDFSSIAQVGSSIRIEHDYKAWLGIMQRVNYMLKLDFDLTDIGKRSSQLVQVLEEKIQEIVDAAPEAGIREYLEKLSTEYVEVPFAPLDDVWENEIRRLLDKFEPDGE